MIICVKTDVVVDIGMVMVTGVVTGIEIATVDNGTADVVAGNDPIAK